MVAELKRANEILTVPASFLRSRARPATHSLVAFINEHRDQFGGVEPIWRTQTARLLIDTTTCCSVS
ncbi:hypothetical protein [Streptomyces canus]|uniref:hypothetical protein n=1 Tax=Streptomyces canus TaxID=58343 RepID=UPI001BC8AFC4|nr:hypothetical protein [Streptomyces canus]